MKTGNLVLVSLLLAFIFLLGNQSASAQERSTAASSSGTTAVRTRAEEKRRMERLKSVKKAIVASRKRQQDEKPIVIKPIRQGVSETLMEIAARQIPPVSKENGKVSRDSIAKDAMRELKREAPAGVAMGPLVETFLQEEALAPSAVTPGASFEGPGTGIAGYTVDLAPPDPTLAVGPNHVFAWVNINFMVFDKAGTPLLPAPGFLPGNQIWAGLGGGSLCATTNRGDPIVQYDRQANRWVLSQFAFNAGRTLNSQCVAVSQTGDPLGAYNLYEYSFGNLLPDYGKLGIWNDAYYISYNMFTPTDAFAGGRACAYDRAVMLAGGAATQICFNSTSRFSMLPADIDGPTPPTDTTRGGLFLDWNWAFFFTPPYTMRWSRLKPDFVTPGNSTFNDGYGGAAFSSVPFSLGTLIASCSDNGNACIPQLGTANLLDTLGSRHMYRLAYRNRGGVDSLIVSQSVDPDGAGPKRSALQWFEIRNPLNNPADPVVANRPFIHQSSTYSPGTTENRFMSSGAMNANGDILFGYSISSTTTNPSIAVAGRRLSDPLNTLQAEQIAFTGLASQTTGTSRWGDYTTMQVDPADDTTFWYINQYQGVNGSFNWRTRILSFAFPGNTPPTITAAGVTRQAGSPGSNSTIATVNDTETPAGNLTVTVNGGASATDNGITVSNLVNTNGTITADVVAACGAGTETFILEVTDGDGATANALLTVTVTPNTPPTLTSPTNATVVFGQSGVSLQPGAPPSDNGSIASVVIQSAGTFTGNISVNSLGVVSISNAGPVGAHIIAIRATDNCGAFSTVSFQVTVNKADSKTTVQPVVNPAVYGDNVQLTASLTAVAPGAGTPQGLVNFSDGGFPIVGCQGLSLNSFGSVTCTTNALPAGNRTIFANYVGNANFNASEGSTTQTINKKTLDVTASSHTVTYGDAAPTVTATIPAGQFVLGQNQSVLTTQPSCSTTYAQGSGVAGSPYPTSCSGAAAANYQFNYIGGTVLVNKKALSMTADNKSRGYGAANPTLTFTPAGFIAGDNLGNSTTGSPGLSTTATATSPVGAYPIAITLGTLASANYSFGTLTNGTLTVNSVQLAVTAENKSRVYGAPNPTLTFTVTGFANGEGVGSLTGSPNLSTTANATSAPGNYPITVSQGTLANPNYTFAFVNGNLTVSQAATTTTITNAASLAANPTTVGQSYAVNWSVAPVAPATGTPTGNVTISDGTGATCSAAASVGTCNLTSTTVGTKTITAVYAGDTNFAGSSASASQHNVVIALTGNVKQFIAFGTNTNLAGVTLTLLNTGTNQATTTTTDASGNYSFGVITLGQNYTITPSGLGKAFEATSRTYTNVNTNIANANFLAYDVPGPNAIPRTARVVSQTTTPGTPVTIPVLVTTTGVETSVAFTIQYTPGVLGVPTSIVCGTGAVGCNLTVDNSLPGRVGITVTPAASLTAGTVQLVRVTFPTFANNLTGTPVTFGDFPTARSVRNAENNPLPVLYWTDGQVAFTGGTLLEGGSISGRVLMPNGQALRGATVVVVDAVGNRWTATTGSFGTFSFENLELGKNYMVSVTSRRYRFATRTVNLNANLTGLDMIGLE
jgi:hypothetical protein